MFKESILMSKENAFAFTKTSKSAYNKCYSEMLHLKLWGVHNWFSISTFVLRGLKRD